MNNYVKLILDNTDKSVASVNEFISSLQISNNSKRMVTYHWKKYAEENNLDYSNLVQYKQEFKTKKNDLTYEEVEICRSKLWNDKIKFVFNGLLETGMRVGEFVSIKWNLVDDTTIPVKTSKNQNEYRYTFISDETLSTLNRLKESFFDFDDLNEDNIQYELRQLGKLAELTISLSPHVLRRTKGSLMRLNGAKIEDIADVLGHKSMETTRKYYSKLNEQYLKSISNLSDIKPSEAIELNILKTENEYLKKQILLLKQELEHEKSKRHKYN